MIWWILLGGLALGVLVLGLAAAAPLRRLPALRRALRRLADRAGEAQRLQAGAQALAVDAQALAADTQAVAAGVRTLERRGHGPDRSRR